MPDKPDLYSKVYCEHCANQVVIYLFPKPEHNWFLVKQGELECYRSGGPMQSDTIQVELEWWMEHYNIVPHIFIVNRDPTAEELQYIGKLGA